MYTVLLLLFGCSFNLGDKWQKLSFPKFGFSVEMPGVARHFILSSQGYKGSEGYEEWIVTEENSGNQYLVLVQELQDKTYNNRSDSWLLDNASRPDVGFLSNAEELSNNREYEGSLIFDEQYWDLKKGRKAVTRTCIINGRLVQLIFIYKPNEQMELSGRRFLESLQLAQE